MDIREMNSNDLLQIKEIYLEAFPKCERKPFFCLKRAIKKNKAIVYVAIEENTVCGFIVTYPYDDMVLVDYLAINKNMRSKGTGSKLLQYVKQIYQKQTIVLLIEKLDKQADNYEIRVARRKFYLKNEFKSSHLYMSGASGDMEIMIDKGFITFGDFIQLMRYSLGFIFFKLSRIKRSAK